MPIQDMPKDESHVFFKGNMTALYYPISKDTMVWTVTASTARLQEVGLDLRLHSSASQKAKDKVPVDNAASSGQQQDQHLSASEVFAGQFIHAATICVSFLMTILFRLWLPQLHACKKWALT